MNDDTRKRLIEFLGDETFLFFTTKEVMMDTIETLKGRIRNLEAAVREKEEQINDLVYMVKVSEATVERHAAQIASLTKERDDAIRIKEAEKKILIKEIEKNAALTKEADHV
jgi:uncharacterized coiled-coil protein SlyX